MHNNLLHLLTGYENLVGLFFRPRELIVSAFFAGYGDFTRVVLSTDFK
jgi:hypothetical protein